MMYKCEALSFHPLSSALSGEQIQQEHRPMPARHGQVRLQIRAEETE